MRLLLALAVAGAAVWLAVNRESLDPVRVEAFIRALGVWAPLAMSRSSPSER